MASSHSHAGASNIAVATKPPLGTRRAVRGGIFGNYVDQFDIFLPVIALAPASAQLFGSDNLIGNAGLIFVATLLGRPVGAAIFGSISDRIGRTATTKVALLGVALTTLLIALVPDHTVLGGGTLAAILLLRFVGGIFLGGEYTSAIPLAMEWSRPERRGLVSGLIMWMSPWANASIAGLVFVLQSVLDAAAYNQWGWRTLFVLGSLLAFTMLFYYRARVEESPQWQRPVQRANPLKEILVGRHRRALWQVFIMMSGLWLLTNMAIPVLAGQLGSGAGALGASGALDGRALSFAMMIGTAASALTMAACGHLSTFTGRRRFFMGFGVLTAVGGPLAFLAVFAAPSLGQLVLGIVVLQVVTVSAYGPVGAYLVERFPTAVRASGYGVGYSLSIVIPALYPYYLPALQSVLGQQGAVAALLALGGVLIAVGAFLGPETARVDLDASGSALT
ncbi:MFS transporter [Salinibacterium sp. UTAS2018]|uniref:MFS transporter n=1 Tax=Salinibacterium sp. UTAS2018 TaxID=2508880 RepID=UPI001009818E|nr:MFS transporter [Salinibacterium sp. UTAS2018]QAV71350.1 MFS transporter [Salinibacterium sp. UTAS2018]